MTDFQDLRNLLAGSHHPMEYLPLIEKLEAKYSTANVASAEPSPTGDGVVIVDLVVDDLVKRADFGKEKYGTKLRTHNGRNPLVDAYQEALDLCMYLRQAIEEKRLDDKEAEELAKWNCCKTADTPSSCCSSDKNKCVVVEISAIYQFPNMECCINSECDKFGDMYGVGASPCRQTADTPSSCCSMDKSTTCTVCGVCVANAQSKDAKRKAMLKARERMIRWQSTQ